MAFLPFLPFRKIYIELYPFNQLFYLVSNQRFTVPYKKTPIVDD